MARRILNRKDLRAQAEAAERTKGEDHDEDEDEEDAEEDDEEAVDDEADEEEGEGDEEEEAKPKKKKAPAKPKAKPRTRTPKVVRLKAMWGVFDNSNKRVAVFDYPRREAAEAHATKLAADKKGGSAVFFVQLVKEPLEEKKEKE
jgi:hypothetical protein